jgi:hypothetical protein
VAGHTGVPRSRQAQARGARRRDTHRCQGRRCLGRSRRHFATPQIVGIEELLRSHETFVEDLFITLIDELGFPRPLSEVQGLCEVAERRVSDSAARASASQALFVGSEGHVARVVDFGEAADLAAQCLCLVQGGGRMRAGASSLRLAASSKPTSWSVGLSSVREMGRRLGLRMCRLRRGPQLVVGATVSGRVLFPGATLSGEGALRGGSRRHARGLLLPRPPPHGAHLVYPTEGAALIYQHSDDDR